MEEENRENTEEELPSDPLDRAEKYIECGKLYEAQDVLKTVKKNSGRKHYLQSKIYKEKRWYNEQRKQLKAAVKAEPDNEVYKKELDELLEFSKTSEYKSTIKYQRTEDMTNCCLECSSNICEGISFCN